MLAFKPFTATVRQVSQTAGTGGVMGNPAAAPFGVHVSGLFMPMRPSESFARFGVVLNDPVIFMVDPGDAPSFAPEAEVIFGSDEYRQVGNVELHVAGDPADHAVIYLRKVQYPDV